MTKTGIAAIIVICCLMIGNLVLLKHLWLCRRELSEVQESYLQLYQTTHYPDFIAGLRKIPTGAPDPDT